LSSRQSSLAGKRIVITRAALQSSELFAKLLERRAIPRSLPLVSFSPPQDYAPLDAALGRWRKQELDWVLFTSANAVQSVVSRSATLGFRLAQPGAIPRVATVGPATAEAAKAEFSVEHIAKTHLGVALAGELAPQLRDKNVFLPRSDRANPDLPTALRELGARLTEVVAYRTLPPTDVDRERISGIANGEADSVLFFSPTAVHNFADLIGKQRLSEIQHQLAIAAVGPVTSAALREYGIHRIVVAADTTTDAVIAALEAHFTAIAAAQQPIAGAKHG
jgi:uroporphyrinogen III methyltransferase/synthase